MTEDHVLVDREGESVKGGEMMTVCWVEFFQRYPRYRNTFTRVESRDDLVILVGYAEWDGGGAPHHAIWTGQNQG